MRARILLAAAVATLVVLPSVAAHIDFARPSIQGGQPGREVSFELDGRQLEVEMLQRGDPFREYIRHHVSPRGTFFEALHRPHSSSESDQVKVQWQLARLVEYRDETRDGKFQPDLEPIGRAWRFEAQAWSETPVRVVSVGGVSARDVLWQAANVDGPNFTLEVAAAGRPFADEGARVFAQDVILYFDVHDLPPRGVNHLYSLEGRVVTSPEADVQLQRVENTTVGAFVDERGRRAFFTWGGEARLDNREQRLSFTLDAPKAEGGNTTRAFRLDLPQFEHDARFVMVSGIEYASGDGRPPFIPGVGMASIVGALCVVALVLSRGARR